MSASASVNSAAAEADERSDGGRPGAARLPLRGGRRRARRLEHLGSGCAGRMPPRRYSGSSRGGRVVAHGSAPLTDEAVPARRLQSMGLNPIGKCGESANEPPAGRAAKPAWPLRLTRPGAKSTRRWCRRSRTSWTAPCRSGASCALCGTRSIAVSTDGLSRLSVGGAIVVADGEHARRSPRPRRRRRAGGPIADLVDDMASLPAALPNRRSTARELDLVAHRRRGAVRVDVVDVARRRCRRASAPPHAAIGAVAVLGRRGDVVGVARHAVADDLGVDLGAARLGVLVAPRARRRRRPRP